MESKTMVSWCGVREVLELVDVTDEASETRTRPEGWRVKMTRQVWERYVGNPEDCGPDDSVGHRLADICAILWVAIQTSERPTDWVLGGVEFGICTMRRSVRTARGIVGEFLQPSVTVTLTAIAIIDTDGSPALLILAPHDHCNWKAARRVA